MKSLVWILLSALLGGVNPILPVGATFPLSSVEKKTNLPAVPRKFIIELDTISSITAKGSPVASVSDCLATPLIDH